MVADFQILMFWQHGNLVAVNAHHSTLKMNQLALTYFHHVTGSKIMTHFRLWFCHH